MATFASVRSANAAARTAERTLQANLRPLVVQSRLDDTTQKMRWYDDHWAHVGGSRAVAEIVDGKVYMAMSVRNVGSGMAILHGWVLRTELTPAMNEPAHPSEFRMQTRDLYVPPGDVGFWQAAIREPDDPYYPALVKVIENREPFMVELLYGDHEGGQRTISRFGVFPYQGEMNEAWLASVNRHWNLDRPNPR